MCFIISIIVVILKRKDNSILIFTDKGKKMDISIITMIWTVINFILIFGFLGLGIYLVILLIKALKKYIEKN